MNLKERKTLRPIPGGSLSFELGDEKMEHEAGSNWLSPLRASKPTGYYENERPELVRLLSPNARRILDVGCATGAMGRLIKEKHPGCEVVGIEINPEAAEIARQRLDRVIVGDVERVDLGEEGFPKGYFDCIIYGDVLEHLVDPWSVVARHFGYLCPGGQVLASVPNIRHVSIIQNLVSGRWPYASEGILDVTHLRFFTLREAKGLFEGAGYSLVNVSGVPQWQEPARPATPFLDIELNNLILRNFPASELWELGTIQFLLEYKKPAPVPSSTEECKAECGVSSARYTASIIIPTYNKLELTRRCLEALARNTSEEIKYQVVIVDNASTDGTRQFLQELSGDVKVILNDKNLGFARACNQGAEAAEGEYLVFLNNDTEPLPGWLDALLETVRSGERVGAVGCKLLFPDGRVQHAGIVISQEATQGLDILPYNLYWGSRQTELANKERKLQAVTGACMLIPRKVFWEVGGFDEAYYNGCEDVDLCFRLRERGYEILYTPRAQIIHHESASGPERYRRVRQNLELLNRRWRGKVQPDDQEVYISDGLVARFEPSREGIFLRKIEPLGEVSIILLVCHREEQLRLCLESLSLHTGMPCELILVDQGSPEGTLSYLESVARTRAHVRLIAHAGPLDFAEGINQGLATAKGEYVLFLHSGCVVREDWLKRLLVHLESKPGVAAVEPPAWTTDYFLVRREAIQKIGGFDCRFTIGVFSQEDFCLRLLLAGYKILTGPHELMYCTDGQTFFDQGIDAQQEKEENWRRFKEKWGLSIGLPLMDGYARDDILTRVSFNPELHRIPLPGEKSKNREITYFTLVELENEKSWQVPLSCYLYRHKPGDRVVLALGVLEAAPADLDILYQKMILFLQERWQTDPEHIPDVTLFAAQEGEWQKAAQEADFALVYTVDQARLLSPLAKEGASLWRCPSISLEFV